MSGPVTWEQLGYLFLGVIALSWLTVLVYKWYYNRKRRQVGVEGVRDPENPCGDYRKRKQGESLLGVQADCEGDGHHLCNECVKKKHEVMEPLSNKLQVGEMVCDVNGERGIGHGESPAVATCEFSVGDYDKCEYGQSCPFQVEVTEKDAREYPSIIEKSED